MRFPLIGFTALTVMVGFAGLKPAHAGFEWVAPQPQAAAPEPVIREAPDMDMESRSMRQPPAIVMEQQDPMQAVRRQAAPPSPRPAQPQSPAVQTRSFVQDSMQQRLSEPVGNQQQMRPAPAQSQRLSRQLPPLPPLTPDMHSGGGQTVYSQPLDAMERQAAQARNQMFDVAKERPAQNRGLTESEMALQPEAPTQQRPDQMRTSGVSRPVTDMSHIKIDPAPMAQRDAMTRAGVSEPVLIEGGRISTPEREVVSPERISRAMDNNQNADQNAVQPYRSGSSAMQNVAFENGMPQGASDLAGFGSNIPLVMALRQIAPNDYAFAFQGGINPGMQASWNGGQPWYQVLDAMLSDLRLEARVTSDKITIRPASMGRQARAMAETEPAAGASANAGSVARAQATNSADDAPLRLSAYSRPITKPGDRAISEESGVTIRRQVITDPGPTESRQPSRPAGMATELQNIAPAAGQSEASPPTKMTINEMAEKQGVDLNQDTARKVRSSGPQFWEAEAGQSLKSILTRWSEQAGTELIWDASDRYTVSSGIMVHGSLNDAIRALFTEAADAGAFPSLRMNKSAQGATRIVIEDRA